MIDVLESPHDQPAPSFARAAIVTFVIGDVYQHAWLHMCSKSWTSYAQRIGADLIVMKDRIDATDVSRSPAWQKLLILDLPWAKRYERIIWLDSDIVINDSAPDILEYGGPIEKVGICQDVGHISPAEAQIYLEATMKIPPSPRNVLGSWITAVSGVYVKNNTPPHDIMYNTGVMVLSPLHHNEALKSIYSYPQLSRLYEQPQLSHYLLKHDIAHVLSPRYNWVLLPAIELIFNKGKIGEETPEFTAQIIHFIVRSQLNCAYFLHFYGAMSLLTHYADTVFADAPGLSVAAE